MRVQAAGPARGPAEVTVAHASCLSLHLAVLGKGRSGVLGTCRVRGRPDAPGLRFCAVVVQILGSGVRTAGLGGERRLESERRTPHFLAPWAVGLGLGRRDGRLFQSSGPSTYPCGSRVVREPWHRRPAARLRFGRPALLRVLRLRGRRLGLRGRPGPSAPGFGVLWKGLLPGQARPSLGASSQRVRAPGGRLPGGGGHVVVHHGGRKRLFVFRLLFAVFLACGAAPTVRSWVRLHPGVNPGGRGGRRGAGGVQPGCPAVAKPVWISAVGSEGPVSERTEVSRHWRACGQPGPKRWGGGCSRPPSLFRITVSIAIGVTCSFRGLCPRGGMGGGRGRPGGP